MVKVAKGADALHDLYMACVTRITLWNLALYSKTDHKKKLPTLLLVFFTCFTFVNNHNNSQKTVLYNVGNILVACFLSFYQKELARAEYHDNQTLMQKKILGHAS